MTHQENDLFNSEVNIIRDAEKCEKNHSVLTRRKIFPGSINLKKELVRMIHGTVNKKDKIALKGQLIDFIRSIE